MLVGVLFGGVCTSVLASQLDVKRVEVYLLGGQSNADGYGQSDLLLAKHAAPQEKVLFFQGNGGGFSPLPEHSWISLQAGSGSKKKNAGRFGPELSFGFMMQRAQKPASGRIALIKYTVGGSNLQKQWRAGGDGSTCGDGPMYCGFQETISEGLSALKIRYPNAEIQVIGMLWHQGESDCKMDRAVHYETNLMKLISDVRLTYGQEMIFLIGQLSKTQYVTVPEGFSRVVQAQAAVAATSPLNGLVTSEGVSVEKGNQIHFNTAGQWLLGTRYANAMQQHCCDWEGK